MLSLLLLGCTAASRPSHRMATDGSIATVPDESAINRAVAAAYEGVSFAKGEAPDFAALRAAFTPDAVLRNFRGGSLSTQTIDQFVSGFRAAYDSGNFTGFHEVELGGRTEQFGRVAHRISAYASYINGADTIGERGVNSFQLLKIDGEWLISSVNWDIESEELPIPEGYLGKN